MAASSTGATRANLLSSWAHGGFGFLAFCVALLLAAVVRLPQGFGPFSVDEYAYVTMARELLAGDLPLSHAWLNRGPIGFVVYALPAALPVDIDVALTLFALVISAITAWLAGRSLSRHFAARWAWFGLVIVALTSADPAIQANGANMEHPIGLLVVAALFVAFPGWREATGRRIFLAGLLLGLAVGMKETAAAFVLPLLAAVRWSGSRQIWFRDLAALAAGTLLPTVSVWGAYAALGRAQELLAVLSFHAGYSGLKPVDLVQGPLLMLAARGTALYVFWPMLLPAAWLLMRLPWRSGFALASRLLLLAAAVAVTAPGFFFAHYYGHLVLPLVFATVAWLEDAASQLRRKWVAPAIAVALACWAAALEFRMAGGQMPLVVRELSPITATGVLERELGKEIGRRARREDRLFVFGWAPTVYAHAGLRPAAPDIWGITMAGQLDAWSWSMKAWLVEKTCDALRERPPDWIVVADVFLDGEVDRLVREMIETEYLEVVLGPEAAVPAGKSITLYRRHEPS